jgi:hypothetical protein
VLILGLVLAMMVVLLYAGFGVLRQALLVLGAVPLATLGGLIALHATGTTLNVASGVGFIALFGVAVMNGVIMVANLNHVRERGVPLFDAVLTGAAERLRPVLMTATVATAGRNGDRHRQRRAARPRHRRRRRADHGDTADAVHHPDVLSRGRAPGGEAGCSDGSGDAGCERGVTLARLVNRGQLVGWVERSETHHGSYRERRRIWVCP